MEAPALEAIRAAGLQAPNADLPSLPAWRCQDRPPTPEALDAVLGRAVPRSPSGDTGQSRQADGRRRRREEPRARSSPDAGPRAVPAQESAAHPPGLDSQTWHPRAAPPGHPDDGGPGRTGPGQAGPGTRMGGALRAEQLRVPPRTLL